MEEKAYWDVAIAVCVEAPDAETAWQDVNNLLPNDVDVLLVGEPMRVGSDEGKGKHER